MTVIYPGSFDPPTVGHLDIIQRASRLFDEVWVIAMVNEKKRPLFSPEERVGMLKTILRSLPNVRVDFSSRLLIEEYTSRGAQAILRGLRGTGDFLAEQPVSDAMLKMYGAETVFLKAEPEHSYVSSSLVKEILRFGGDISPLVPGEILSRIEAKTETERGTIHGA
ncbi:MAG: pantetheine-phosphate adenylyltransferase [Christensenellales bacterium]|jgi:pantetheine-phosphate adenylyltransferase